MASISSSLTPRIATMLILMASPAAWAAAMPVSTSSIRPRRVICRKRSGSSVSRETLTRRTPAPNRLSACLPSWLPLVVRVSSSSPLPILLPRLRTSDMISRRTSGSPPVSRILVVPRAMKAPAMASTSSKLSTSFLGRKVMSSAMQ
ncbi:hypothetical protein D3C87_1786070 [compost metagenome]